MVSVPVDHGYFRSAFHECCCRHRHVVQETETHCPRRFRVVAGRAHGGKPEIGKTPLDRFDCGESRTRSVLRRGPRSCRHIRVRIEGTPALHCDSLHTFEVAFVVNREELRSGRRSCFDLNDFDHALACALHRC